MGLAAYGQPEFLDEFRRIVRTDGGAGFRLDLDYFTHHRVAPELSWRDATRHPNSAAYFLNISKAAWGQPARRASLFPRGITTSPRPCKHGWKKSISHCCVTSKTDEARKPYAWRAEWHLIA